MKAVTRIAVVLLGITWGGAEGWTDEPKPPRGYGIPLIDLASQQDRRVIVDREAGQYLGHPTTVLLEDGKTMLAVYPKGHGKGAIVLKRSTDAGKTWSERLPTPKNWETSQETPTIYRVIDRKGVKRLILFSGLHPIRMAVSEDDGKTWSELKPIGNFGGIVAMGSVARLKNGDYMALFHDDGRFLTENGKKTEPRQTWVYKTISKDGGLTWGQPVVICHHAEAHLVEPGLIRSPDGKQMAVLLRENSRKFNSFVIFSDDEGETWSKPRELPGALTGDRHVGKFAADGRLFITFRDTTLDSPTKGDWVGWVGTYDDIVKGREGQYRVRLMKNHKGYDCAYAGLELLPDGAFVTTTYGHWMKDEQPFIVSVRFTLKELDALAKQANAGTGVNTVPVGTPRGQSNVPSMLAQGKFLAPQSISALDITSVGRRIAVTTMAYRHDRNFWVLSDEGKVLWSRSVLPWAPFQVAATAQAKTFAVGLAYSRITPPYPTISLFQDEKSEETVLTDNLGERGWLRYGNGDWRTGWLASALGDQIVRAGDSVFTIATGNGAWHLTDDAAYRKLPPPFPAQRPYRLASSADGRVVAFTYIVPDVSRLEKGAVPENVRVQAPPALLSLRSTRDWKELGSVKPAGEMPAISKLPEPAKDFPELAEKFVLRPDAVLPFWVAASVAVNADGSRIAVTEYAGWLWVRGRPAIGRWDPPYHVIPFVPRQRGWLRIVSTAGEEVVRTQLPREGLFEVGIDRRGERAWCSPLSWFARGMAGCTWRPADEDARTVFGYTVSQKRWTSAWDFPDAVSNLAVHPDGEQWLVSCWDGKLYLLDAAGRSQATVTVDSPARLQWSREGRFAIAGTQNGELVCLGADGKQRWRVKLPEAELAPLKQPSQRVFDELPIYQVGRVGPEHAYVGDTWLIKMDRGGILVDTGGTSGIPLTLQRMKSAGVDLKEMPYLLHSHSHGDHCGAGYLWRAMGLKIVAPESANLPLAWLMPMVTDYGVWVPRPVDVALPLKRAGDETTITLGDLKVRAIFVPGHSVDSVVYALELAGKRVVFTGDIGFENQDILHRCWGDVEKAKAVTEVIRTKVLGLKPDYVFRGHGARRDGTAFLEDLVKRSQESIRQAEQEKKP